MSMMECNRIKFKNNVNKIKYVNVVYNKLSKFFLSKEFIEGIVCFMS